MITKAYRLQGARDANEFLHVVPLEVRLRVYVALRVVSGDDVVVLGPCFRRDDGVEHEVGLPVSDHFRWRGGNTTPPLAQLVGRALWLSQGLLRNSWRRDGGCTLGAVRIAGCKRMNIIHSKMETKSYLVRAPDVFPTQTHACPECDPHFLSPS